MTTLSTDPTTTTAAPDAALDNEALLQRRAQEVARGLGMVLPSFIERATPDGTLVAHDGREVIDFASGIAVTSVGAAHPKVVAAITEQAQRFTHTCFMVSPYTGYVEVAAWLNAHTPGDFAKKTALFSTGAEAIENAVKIARSHTGRPGVIVFDNAYHGRSLFTLAMTAKEAPYKLGFGPFDGHVYRAPFADPLRSPGGAEQAADAALDAVAELLEAVGADTIAAMVIEPIQGEGGFLVPAPGFLTGLAELAAKHGIVMVADEVQAGMARTGRLFASEHDGLVPDLVVSAKALAGGMPLAAVTGRAEVMDSVGPGGLGGTYGGNPMACAAALAVFEVIEEEGLVERAAWIEQVAREILGPVVDASEQVAELRGRGAMLAVEFVKPGGIEPDAAAAAQISAACHAADVLTLVCGMHGNVIRMLPPLTIAEQTLRDGLATFARAIQELP